MREELRSIFVLVLEVDKVRREPTDWLIEGVVVKSRTSSATEVDEFDFEEPVSSQALDSCTE